MNMKPTIFVSVLCFLQFTYAKVPNGYVDPTDIKKYERGRYSSYRHQDPDVERLEIVQNACDCEVKECKRYEDDVAMLHLYHKRIINSLINTLRPHRNGYALQLKTIILEEQLEILKNYGSTTDLNYDTLRQVDDLLSDILFEAQKITFAETVNDYWFTNFQAFLTTQNIIIMCITAAVYTTYRLIHIRFSICRAICLFVFVLFIVGFGWTWHNLVEEEEIKLTAARMQFPIPPECNAAEMTWWQRLMSKAEVDCEKFVRAHNKKAFLSITPQMVLSEMFGQSLSTFLSHIIGTFAEFITKMHATLPFPFNYLSLPFLLLFVLILILLLVVICSRTHLRASFLNLFHFEIGKSNSSKRGPTLRANDVYIEEIEDDEPRRIAYIRQRRPRVDAVNAEIEHRPYVEPVVRLPEAGTEPVEEAIEDNDIPTQSEPIVEEASGDEVKEIDENDKCSEVTSCTKDDDKSHGDDCPTSSSADVKESAKKKVCEIGDGDVA